MKIYTKEMAIVRIIRSVVLYILNFNLCYFTKYILSSEFLRDFILKQSWRWCIIVNYSCSMTTTRWVDVYSRVPISNQTFFSYFNLTIFFYFILSIFLTINIVVTVLFTWLWSNKNECGNHGCDDVYIDRMWLFVPRVMCF